MKKINKLLAIVTSSLLIILMITSSLVALATSGLAYSIGGEFHNGADVRKACDYWALCGYKSYYTCEPTYSYVSNANYLNSSIVYFSAHGNQDAIFLLNNIAVSDGYGGWGQIVNINNYTLSNTKLVVYDACSTASNSDGTGINLCSTTLNRGADAVLGWTDTIGVDDAFKWQKRFQNHLALGYTINASIKQADRYNDYNNNVNIKSHRLYGNGAVPIKRSRSIINGTDVRPRSLEFKNIELFYNNIDFKALENEIKKCNATFSIDDYNITITSTSSTNKNFVIDLQMIFNGAITNSGYTIIVENNVVTDIVDNTITILKKGKSITQPIVTDSIVKKAYKEAENEVYKRKDGSTIKSQEGKLFFDCNKGKFFYNVYTVYNYMNTDGLGAFTYSYEISQE